MTRIKLNQSGVSHVIALVLVAVVAVVGFAGYRVMNATDDAKSDNQAVADVSEGKYNSNEDIVQGAKELDEEQVDKNLDPSQLDEDLGEL